MSTKGGGKRVNLKTEVTRKQITPNFPKNEHLLPPDTHTYEDETSIRPEVFYKNLYNFIKIETLAQVFSCEFCEIFKNNFFYRLSLVAASAETPICRRSGPENFGKMIQRHIPSLLKHLRAFWRK